MVSGGRPRSEEVIMIESIMARTKQFRDWVSSLDFSRDDITVYNPLEYAWEPHENYLRRYASTQKEVVFLGMNPGPWGMAQTGVPFGDVEAVRDWMGISGNVDAPAHEHPARPILGFSTTRGEVSGSRLWGYMKERFGAAENFFSSNTVLNYCPLVFMETSGRNLTPDKLPKGDRMKLEQVCDDYLADMLHLLKPRVAVGVGKYAQKKLSQVIAGKAFVSTEDRVPSIGWVLHPSPASPAANRGWAQQAEKQLSEQGIWN